MKKNLQAKLFKKYPKLLPVRNIPKLGINTHSSIYCGDGWYSILEYLCRCIQFDIDTNKQPQIEFITVKEKFGGLRIYTDGGSERQYGMLCFAESLSTTICENCGSFKGKLKQRKG